MIEGRASVTEKIDNVDVKVSEMGQYDHFGEITLLLNRPRTATVRAEGILQCVQLSKVQFESLLAPCVEHLKKNIEKQNGFIVNNN